MTPSGIETATFRFVAQHLNHRATNGRINKCINKCKFTKTGKSRAVSFMQLEIELACCVKNTSGLISLGLQWYWTGLYLETAEGYPNEVGNKCLRDNIKCMGN